MSVPRCVRLAAALALPLALAAARPTAAAPADTTADGFRMAVAPYTFRFPRDHASHPDTRTEWWYFTGHLRAGSRRFGYELTFFRVGVRPRRGPEASAWALHDIYLAHLALTDETRGRFRFHERVERPSLGLAGADTSRLHVWVGDWTCARGPDGRTIRLGARAPDFALALELTPLKPPVIHGEGGVSRKGEGRGRATHYVSFTRLATGGTLTVGGRVLVVEGVSWMDHEFGSDALTPDEAGWDWWSVQLDDGRELMLYRLRRRDGTSEPASSGTLVERDGRSVHLPLAAFSTEATGEWTSARSGARYPSGWRLRVPRAGLDLDVTPTVRDQELVSTGPAGLTYWEGSVRVRGTAGGRPVTGVGYVELTGYAGAPPSM